MHIINRTIIGANAILQIIHPRACKCTLPLPTWLACSQCSVAWHAPLQNSQGMPARRGHASTSTRLLGHNLTQLGCSAPWAGLCIGHWDYAGVRALQAHYAGGMQWEVVPLVRWGQEEDLWGQVREV